MKKDKEWAIEYLEKSKKHFENKKYFSYGDGVYDGLREGLSVINQLDEPEIVEQQMSISEWLDEWDLVAVDKLDYEALTQDEPSKPLIPKFVAEWYESEGKLSSWWNWFYKWGRDDSGGDLEEEVIEWMQDYNEENFVDIFRCGYEVEEEQKYYVLDKEDATLLKKTDREGVAKSVGTNIYNVKNWKDEEKYQLTEQEIKDYDERFWPFAVKVEELEE